MAARSLAALLLSVGVAACGSSDGASTADTDVVPEASPPQTRSPDTRYQIHATVLDDGDGPELCAGGVATSYPPQCGGPSVTPWDWGAITGYSSANGVRWGEFHLVGTWDGSAFTLTEPPTPSTATGEGEPEELDSTPPCPEPEGGWQTASTTLEQWQAFMAAAREPADLAAFWVHRRGPGNDPNRDVYVAAYTGDIEAHRAALEEIWPGPLCVVQFERSLDDLRAIQMELSDPALTSSLGLYATSTGIDEVHRQIVLGVLVDEPEAQAALDARYGPELIVLRPVMTPVG